MLAASLLFEGRVIPGAVRTLGRVVAHGAMRWLDARRERAENRDRD